MEKKQTAVDWLEKLYKEGILIPKSFEQAKAMEKQQMLTFWNGGINCTEENGKSFDQFLEETYGTE